MFPFTSEFASCNVKYVRNFIIIIIIQISHVAVTLQYYKVKIPIYSLVTPRTKFEPKCFPWRGRICDIKIITTVAHFANPPSDSLQSFCIQYVYCYISLTYIS